MKKMNMIRLGWIITVLTVLLWTGAAAAAGTLTLPADTKVIEEQAFYGLTGVTEVVLPDGVLPEDIGNGAFGGSESLRAVEVSSDFLNGMTEEQIKNRRLFQKITLPCTLVLIFLYILLMPKIGFTIATFFFLTLQITLLSTDISAKSWLKSLLIALVASVGIYVIFGCAFGLAVPKVSFIDLGLSSLYRSIFG